MKFVKNPGPHWNFQPLTNVWDPDFIEGGFDVPELETTTAKPFVVASDNFVEKKIADCRGVGFVNEIGKGRVVFLASLDSPGAFGVRKLYFFLLAKAMEAVGADTWPKVEYDLPPQHGSESFAGRDRGAFQGRRARNGAPGSRRDYKHQVIMV